MNIIVVGGGAAGFFGAIACAEAHPDAHITILEAGAQPLTKVRISGGGRCNVTHACFDAAQLIQSYPRGGKALRGAFSRFQPKDTVAWFAQHQVPLKTEADGRMFPTTDDSSTIVQTLMRVAQEKGIVLKTKAAVSQVHRIPEGFEVALRDGQVLRGDRLLLATGSTLRGYAIAQQLGHPIEPPVPSLFTFQIPDPSLHHLAGISRDWVQAQLHVPNHPVLKQEGSILITHWGLSGPVILKLSAWGARILHDSQYQGTVRVNWCPQFTPEQVREMLMEFKQENLKRAIATANPLTLPRRLWEYLVQKSQRSQPPSAESSSPSHHQEPSEKWAQQQWAQQQWAHLSKKALNRLVQELTQSDFPIHGKGVFKDEFVTCGGVSLKSVNFKTMESRLCPGLHFAGEILDIDGITGGFNFQSAWTTGWIAGRSMS